MDADKARDQMSKQLASKARAECFNILGNHPDGIPCALFKGYWLPVVTPLFWNKTYNFEYRPDDITIVAHPKSGN